MSSESKTEKRKQGCGIRALLIFTIILLLICSAFVVFILGRTGGVDTTIPVLKAAYLRLQVLRNDNIINSPASTFPGSVLFVVDEGETTSVIAERLQSESLIQSSDVFEDYLVLYGYDRQINAGIYDLSPSMTMPQIASKLITGDTAKLVVTIIEGWRREEIAEWIDEQPSLPITGEDFLNSTHVSSSLSEVFLLSGDLGNAENLEGFLFPDTYVLPVNFSADTLVNQILNNYMSHITVERRAAAAESGMTMREILTLASIVEREIIHEDEGKDVASVYLNRLSNGMKLEACPTVQYAVGFSSEESSWWPANLTLIDYQENESPYNTYLNWGLPPGPISSPGIAAIDAVLFPSNTPYFYFRAACDGSGRHNFSITYEEHLENACD